MNPNLAGGQISRQADKEREVDSEREADKEVDQIRFWVALCVPRCHEFFPSLRGLSMRVRTRPSEENGGIKSSSIQPRSGGIWKPGTEVPDRNAPRTRDPAAAHPPSRDILGTGGTRKTTED